jgi:hypothetical protein
MLLTINFKSCKFCGITEQAQLTGRGLLYKENNFTYLGPLSNAEFSQFGIYIDWQQLFMYVGEFKDGTKNGFGILTQYHSLSDLKQTTNQFNHFETNEQSTFNIQYDQSISDSTKSLEMAKLKLNQYFSIAKSKIEYIVGLHLKNLSSSEAEECYNYLSKGLPNISEIEISNKAVYTYAGYFSSGMKSVIGIEIEGESSFIGSFTSDFKTGIGISLFRDSQFYIGQIEQDLYHGKGALFKDGTLYLGSFVKDNYEGYGLILDIYGKGHYFYSGSMKQGKKDGQCKIVLHNGDIYEGGVEDDCYHSTGKYVSTKHGVTIYGNFESNKLEGDAKLEKESETLECDATQSQFNGRATISGNKSIACNLQNSAVHGKAEWHADGSVVEGTYSKGKRDGVFKQTTPKGSTRTIVYSKDIAKDK